ncbi:uncharacterized protein ARMOST_14010 [Armillaria ostoyae]|uniref:Uncharacterized protein n=1 Tax=Armillaria ostoyae TaxID=47428 RepID=A0A284RPD8_ARMOS|nr:uncharacterized protein ARMOST_14010 [Armillaria ostoyae]
MDGMSASRHINLHRIYPIRPRVSLYAPSITHQAQEETSAYWTPQLAIIERILGCLAVRLQPLGRYKGRRRLQARSALALKPTPKILIFSSKEMNTGGLVAFDRPEGSTWGILQFRGTPDLNSYKCSPRGANIE